MKKILGLDIGTNSIGWALITESEENGQQGSIIDLGSRIVPMDANVLNEFERGNKITKNAERRRARGARRLLQRYKLRRNKLVDTLKILGWIPEVFKNGEKMPVSDATISELKSIFNSETVNDNLAVYYLRKKALTEKITISELARVLYHLNQRRGFKSNRKANKEASSSKAEEETSNRPKRTSIIEIVKVNEIINTGEKDRFGNTIFEVKLNDGRTGKIFRKNAPEWQGKELELEVKTQVTKSGEESITFSIPDKTDWEKQKDALEKNINESGLHIGEYFFQQLVTDPLYRVREKIILRKRYEEEFDAIWEKQSELNPELNSNSFLHEIADRLYKNNKEKQKELVKNGLKYIFKNNIIYFQRPLKSQKNSISECRFEFKTNAKGKKFGIKVCPKSAPVFQEFRIWQQINNLKIYNDKEEDITASQLTPEKKEILFKLFDSQKEVTTSAILRAIKLNDKTFKVNFRSDKSLSGNETKAKFRSAFKKFNFDGDSLLNNPEILESLWHLTYSLPEEEDIKRTLQKSKFAIPAALAEYISRHIDFKNEYASISAKAINKLLPLMRDGNFYIEEKICSQALENIEKVKNGEVDEKIDPRTRLTIYNKAETGLLKGLGYVEACAIVYGSHSRQEDVELLATPEQVKPLARHSLKNPVVEQIVNETLQVVKNVWKDLGRPDEIRVELSRDLKSNAAEREKIYKNNINAGKNNQRVIQKLKELPGANPHSLSDIEKYKLWEEQGQVSPYTAKPIPLSKLFGEDYEIEHIIPRMRFFDDSFGNKTICESWINKEKDNRTAWEYIKGGSQKYELLKPEQYESHIRQTFRGKKYKHFLMKEIPEDFIERQKKDTQYIAIRTCEELRKICSKVTTTTGSVTDYLRHQWGLSGLLKNLSVSRFERLQEITQENYMEWVENENGKRELKIKGFSKRIDHRHHAIDALIIACTKQSHIQQLNKLNQIFEKGIEKKEQMQSAIIKSNRKFELPWKGFYEEAREKTDSIIVAHKNRKRLLTKSQNIYKTRDDISGRLITKKQNKNTVKAVRKPLHQETNYGIIKVKEYFQVVVKEALLKLDNVADRKLKMILKARHEQNGNDIKKTLKSLKDFPVYLNPESKEELKKVTIFQFVERAVSRKALDGTITAAQIEKIVDVELKEAIKEHLQNESYKGDAKLAFSEEGLAEFNKTRRLPVYKVRIAEEVGNKIRLREQSDNQKLVVKPGENYCFVVYENEETSQRSFDIVSVFDAVTLSLHNQPIVPPKEGHRHFTLKHYDLVYVPYPNEKPEEIDWNNKSKIAKRIYRVGKYSGNEIYFLPHTISKVLDKEFGTQNMIQVSDEKISIKQVCIKINIDRLGRNIKPVYTETLQLA